MYVDKKLGGVATVQTLSRLNRKRAASEGGHYGPGFVNKQQDIEKDFQDSTASEPRRGTEPQKLYNMKFEVEQLGIFTALRSLTIRRAFRIEKAPGKKISPLFTKIIQSRFAKLTEENQDSSVMRCALRSQYSFVSQIITWIDPELRSSISSPSCC